MKAVFASILLIALITLSNTLKDDEITYYYKDYIKSIGY